MLREHQVLMMFSQLKNAAAQKREPTEQEMSFVMLDALAIIASIVEALTILAEEAERTDHRRLW